MLLNIVGKFKKRNHERIIFAQKFEILRELTIEFSLFSNFVHTFNIMFRIVTAIYIDRILEQVQRRHQAADRERKSRPDRAFENI